MARSDCYCENHSCERGIDDIRRFEYDLDNNVIVNGRIVESPINECPIRLSGEFQRKPLAKMLLGKYVLSRTVEQ